jgi:hypothetical protein
MAVPSSRRKHAADPAEARVLRRPRHRKPPAGPSEQVDHDTERQLLQRIRAEFYEMPGLRLTIAQAQRLFDLPRAICLHILDLAIADGWLSLIRPDTYGRREPVP